MGREFELKYSVSESDFSKIKEKYRSFSSILMETTYYDTPARDLNRRRWMLRLRRENGICICTLKTPLPDGSRGEWEVPHSDPHTAAAALVSQGCPEELSQITASGLESVCSARFIRLAKSVSHGQSQLELALDRGAFYAGSLSEPFSELEIELKSGTQQDCMDFAQSLAAAFNLTPASRSKAQRAFALANRIEKEGSHDDQL